MTQDNFLHRRAGLSQRAGIPQREGEGSAGGPPTKPRPANPDWLVERLAEARAVIADVVHHSDHLIRIACDVLARHGESEAERRDARVLQLVVDARRLQRHAHDQRETDCDADPDSNAGSGDWPEVRS